MSALPSYDLCFPFSLQPEYEVSELKDAANIPSSAVSASLAPTAHGYAIMAKGFPSSTSAQAFVPRLWLGLTTMMLETKAAFSASTEVKAASPIEVSNPSLPAHFQGPRVIVHGGEPYIARSDVKPLTFWAGDARFSVGTPAGRVAAAMARGIDHPQASLLFADPRLRTSVDLFAAAGFEASPPARLLTYAIALEVFTPPSDKHPVAQQLIDRWRTELHARRDSFAVGSLEADALDALERELLIRKQASIRWRIRNFVAESLAAAGASDAPEVAKKAVSAYDKRSTLVHEGLLASEVMGPTIETLRGVLERLFTARIALAAA
jgi:hypothetical protein